MDHSDSSLIATVAIGLSAAFVGGLVARRIRVPPIVGYLIAGVAVGPFTPGLVADPEIALQLAEIGVVLLMFGVGLHFSVRDLLTVRRIAVPGAVGQIIVAIGLGIGVALLIGWRFEEGLVLGLAISVASTVVLLRTLEQRDALGSRAGRVAIGWLIMEDLFTVLALVLLPTVALAFGTQGGAAASQTPLDVVGAIGVAVGKTAVLAAVMLVIGARFLPWLLDHVERDASRELFTLAVLAIALGIAYASSIAFDVSLALGAFLAGAVLSGSHPSERAAQDVLPLSDIFGVLFFVAVGMLLNPAVLLHMPLAILAVVGVVMLGKALAALLIVALLKEPLRTGLTVAAGLAQIGEFSFIVATAGRSLGLLPNEGFQLVVAASLISIALNPVAFSVVGPAEAWLQRRAALPTGNDGRRS